MSRKRKRRERKKNRSSPGSISTRSDSAGFHALVPGESPSPEDLDEASRLYQENIRNSPLWDEMVRQFGKEEAERLLLEFRVEVR
jgi:hypothetical protein